MAYKFRYVAELSERSKVLNVDPFESMAADQCAPSSDVMALSIKQRRELG